MAGSSHPWVSRPHLLCHRGPGDEKKRERGLSLGIPLQWDPGNPSTQTPSGILLLSSPASPDTTPSPRPSDAGSDSALLQLGFSKNLWL